uniref:Uncharacterized protein n=1 Tax=Meloidogyne enterolobii TaxID=390850 RepID=A0A6V7TIK8_MELEN|nr:unnamed protein product [Meloidogyne enterolobii]
MCGFLDFSSHDFKIIYFLFLKCYFSQIIFFLIYSNYSFKIFIFFLCFLSFYIKQKCIFFLTYRYLYIIDGRDSRSRG